MNSLQSKLIFSNKSNSKETSNKLEEFCKEDYYVYLKKRDLVIEGSKNYKVAKSAVQSLLKKLIEFPKFSDKETQVFTGIIQEAEINKRDSTVKLKVSKELLPALVFISNGYTKYSLESAFNCSSSYTMRLYEYIKQWHDIWKDSLVFTLKVQDLRDFLCLGKKYPTSNDVRNHIILKAAEELAEKADIWFDIKEPVKEGKKVVGWKINIYKKEDVKAPKKSMDNVPQNPPLSFDYGIMNQPKQNKNKKS